MSSVKKKVTEAQLSELYYKRLKDFRQYKSRRRKNVEGKPRKMDALLSEYFEADSTALRRIEESRALIAWTTYVGESAARVSRAVRVRGDQLVVSVSDPLWMQQLILLKQALLRRYRTDFPKLNIRDIYFSR